MVTWQVQREVLDTGFARSEPNRVCLRATRDRRDHETTRSKQGGSQYL